MGLSAGTLVCPLCAGPLVDEGTPESCESSDGTSGPWVRSFYRCRRGGARLCHEMIVSYPADSTHWRWLADGDGDDDGDDLCIKAPAPIAPSAARVPATDRRDWLCSTCYGAIPICPHDDGIVEWTREARTMRRVGCGREFTIDIITWRCPRCARTRTHAALADIRA